MLNKLDRWSFNKHHQASTHFPQKQKSLKQNPPLFNKF